MTMMENNIDSTTRPSQSPIGNRYADGRGVEEGDRPVDARNLTASTPWAHIDMAGTNATDRDDSWRPKGPTGGAPGDSPSSPSPSAPQPASGVNETGRPQKFLEKKWTQPSCMCVTPWRQSPPIWRKPPWVNRADERSLTWPGMAAGRA